jgi:hypothetical protein
MFQVCNSNKEDASKYKGNLGYLLERESYQKSDQAAYG